MNRPTRHSARMLRGLVLLVALVGSAAPRAYGQADPEYDVAGPIVRIGTRMDGTTYVYHTLDLPLGYGVRVYRDGVLLTPEPLYRVETGDQLVQMLDPFTYGRLQEPLGEPTPTDLLLRLQVDRLSSGLATFLMPDVARALGRLYVDSTAVAESTPTYRFEAVTPFGQPANLEVEGRGVIRPRRPQPPTDLAAGHFERDVILRWSYPAQPRATLETDDGVMQFYAYRARPDGTAERLDDRPIVRNSVVDTFSVEFQAVRTGVEETYWVTAVDFTGQEGPPSERLTYLVADRTAPAPMPAPEARFVRDGVVDVAWAAGEDEDIAGYHVYRAERGDDEARPVRLTADPVVGARYTDETAEGQGGQGYFYSVSAVDSSGNEGPAGTASMVLVYDERPPATPSDLVATYFPDEDVVGLTWSGGDRAPDFQSYIVYRGRRSGMASASSARLNTDDLRVETWVDRGPDGRGFIEDAVYRYTVAAFDSTRNMSDSVVVDFVLPNVRPPAPPTDVSLDVVDGRSVRVQWTGSDALDMARYRIYRAAGDSAAVLYDSTATHLPGFTDEAVRTAQVYTYIVSAVDLAGNESESSAPATITMRDATPPRVVRNLRVVRLEAGGNRLAWERVVAADLAGYRVYRRDGPANVPERVVELPADALAWDDPAGETAHWYDVRAVDTSGNESRVGDVVRPHDGSSGASR